jgi:hypothetical protein
MAEKYKPAFGPGSEKKPEAPKPAPAKAAAPVKKPRLLERLTGGVKSDSAKAIEARIEAERKLKAEAGGRR